MYPDTQKQLRVAFDLLVNEVAELKTQVGDLTFELAAADEANLALVDEANELEASLEALDESYETLSEQYIEVAQEYEDLAANYIDLIAAFDEDDGSIH